MDFGRVVTAMVTPFDQNLQVDWDATAKLIDFLIGEQRSDGLVVSGTTGESPTLTDEEKIKLFEFVVRHVNGRCKVIAGTGSNSTQHSVHLSREAERVGVDAVLLVAPYYNRPDQEGLYQHFKTIAEQISLPVMLYNVPKRTAVNIDAETTIRLAQIENIVATKECGTLEQITEVCEKTPDSFKVYSGDDSITLPILSVGGYGVVSVASHVIGKEIQAMIEAFFSGDLQLAAKLHAANMPIFSGIFIAPSPGPVKYALNLRGIDTGSVRLPLVMPSKENRKFIENLFS